MVAQEGDRCAAGESRHATGQRCITCLIQKYMGNRDGLVCWVVGDNGFQGCVYGSGEHKGILPLKLLSGYTDLIQTMLNGIPFLLQGYKGVFLFQTLGIRKSGLVWAKIIG